MYVHLCKELIDAPIIRGWDAGKRNPACIWGQWSKQSRRFFVLRELHATDADMYVMRDVVKYLSGQLAYDSLLAHTTGSGANRAYELLEELSLNKAYPRPPWFQGNHAFVDMGGHEFVRGGPGLTKADEPQVAGAKRAGPLESRGPIHGRRRRAAPGRRNGRARVPGSQGGHRKKEDQAHDVSRSPIG